jgi:hypothetical protein
VAFHPIFLGSWTICNSRNESARCPHGGKFRPPHIHPESGVPMMKSKVATLCFVPS